jgi:ABC-2 type transport system ATP-binding protein
MIQVEGLTKYYGEHAAIKNLSFTIERGQVIGFLGLNGAGKTTTLKVLGCVLLPTSGRVTIDGYDVVADPHEIRKRIGFLPDTPPLYDEMSVGDYLAFVAQLRGVPGSEVKKRVAEVEKQTTLEEVHDQVIASLSHGYRQRVGVAQALVHQPKLLILDEPTGGLDPRQIVQMRDLILSLKGGHTVLVSSHILSEISQICDRLLVIQDGEIVAQGSEEELVNRLGGGGVIEIEVIAPPARALEVVSKVPGVLKASIAREAPNEAVLHIEAGADLRPTLVRALVGADIDVLRVDKSVEKLESIFLKLTGGKAKEAA